VECSSLSGLRSKFICQSVITVKMPDLPQDQFQADLGPVRRWIERVKDGDDVHDSSRGKRETVTVGRPRPRRRCTPSAWLTASRFTTGCSGAGGGVVRLEDLVLGPVVEPYCRRRATFLHVFTGWSAVGAAASSPPAPGWRRSRTGRMQRRTPPRRKLSGIGRPSCLKRAGGGPVSLSDALSGPRFGLPIIQRSASRIWDADVDARPAAL